MWRYEHVHVQICMEDEMCVGVNVVEGIGSGVLQRHTIQQILVAITKLLLHLYLVSCQLHTLHESGNLCSQHEVYGNSEMENGEL